jgi:hypothetical protein
MFGSPTIPIRRLFDGLPKIAFSCTISFLLTFFLAYRTVELTKVLLDKVNMPLWMSRVEMKEEGQKS